MVFGGMAQEHIQPNEETLWSGGPYNPVRVTHRGADIECAVAAGHQYQLSVSGAH